MYPEDKSITEILKIIEVFRTRKVEGWTGDELSRLSVKLSTLMVNLGQLVSEATYTANQKYSFRKFAYAKDYKALREDIDTKIADAQVRADLMSMENKNEEIEKQYRADLLKTLYDDCERLIVSIQVRLKYLQSERINSNN